MTIRSIVFAGAVGALALAALLPGRAAAHGTQSISISLVGSQLTPSKWAYPEPTISLGFDPTNVDDSTTVPGWGIVGGGAGQIQATDQIGYNIASPLYFSAGTTAGLAGPELLEIWSNLDDDPPVKMELSGTSPAFQSGPNLRAAGIFLNEHKHYLSYDLLPGNTATGAYGFYLEAKSPQHDTSHRFFMGFNRGLAAANFNSAVLAMRALPRGDMNDDGRLDNFDIQFFEDALGDAAAYEAANPWMVGIRKLRGDINGDGDFTNFDIQPFEALLTGGGSGSLAAVPEPSGIALAALGLVGLASRRRRRRG